MKIFYLILSILGIILPYSQLLLWINDNGLNIPLFIKEAFMLRIGAFAWIDVIISAIVLIAFIIYEGKKLKMEKLWIPIIGTLVIGVSFGFPLFLFFREKHLNG